MTYDDVAELLCEHSAQLHLRSSDTLLASRQQLVVHYSLDSSLQRIGTALLQRYRPKYGAIAIIESGTGRVLSLVSYTNESEPFLGRDLYCRSLFPAASLFKIVTAVGAMEKGRLTPESELRYAGRNYTLYRGQLTPVLREFRTVTLTQAFALSINPVFGRLGIYVLGRNGIEEYASRLGFGLRVPFELPLDSAVVGPFDSVYAQAEIACGFNQQTRIAPVFGALLAAAVSEGGAIPVPRVVDSITDARRGISIYRAQSRVWRVAMRSQTAAYMERMMQEVVRRGTARESFGSVVRNTRALDGVVCGGKTGSVDRDGIGRVDWFVGFARHPSDPRRRLAAGVVTVHGAYWTVHSSYVTAEMFRHYFRRLERNETVAKARGEGGSDG